MAAAQLLDFTGKTPDQVKASLKRYRNSAVKAVAGLGDIPEGVLDETRLTQVLTIETSLLRLRSCVEQCYARHIELLAEAREDTEAAEEELEEFINACEKDLSQIRIFQSRRPPPDPAVQDRVPLHDPYMYRDLDRPGPAYRRPGDRTLEIDTDSGLEVVKLPPSKLPEFSGSYSDWPAFWDQFHSTVGKRKGMAKVTKFTYLKTCLKGEPAELLRGMPVTENNYSEAVKMLRLRYVDERMVLREQLDALIATQSVQTANPIALRKLVNLFTERTLLLRSVGITRGYFMLSYLLVRKLDHETRRAWEIFRAETKEAREQRQVLSDQNEETEPEDPDEKAKRVNEEQDNEYETLLAFLMDRMAAIERAGKGLKYDNPAPPRKVNSLAECDQPRTTPGKSPRQPQPQQAHTESVSVNPGFSSGTQSGNTGSSNFPCACCKKSGHGLTKCPNFVKLSPAQRHTIVKNSGLCFNCISGRHRTPECKSKFTCRFCKRSTHHSLLHREEVTAAAATGDCDPTQCAGIFVTDSVNSTASEFCTDSVNVAATPSNAVPTRSKGISCTDSANSVTRGAVVFLCTVKMPLVNAQGGLTSVRAMLDTGSQCNVITERIAKKLGWPIAKTTTTIQGVGSAPVQGTLGTIGFPVLLPDKSKYKVTAHVMEHAIGHLRTARFPPDFLKQFDGYPLADPEFHTADSVDMLIGIGNYHDFILKERVRKDQMWLQHTVFGWAVSGKPTKGGKDSTTQSAFRAATLLLQDPADTPYTESAAQDYTGYVASIVTDNGLQDFQRFWETEEPPDIAVRLFKKEEKECGDHYDETTTRSPDGRVIVSLPFREGSPSLGHSKSQAVRRFFSVEAKLLREPIFKEKYVEFMREFISMGHLERVSTDSEEPDPTRSFYVPHHGVLKESSTTTKLRVVFDASAKTSSGVSLNDNLLVGPRIQDEIFKILIRFRFYAIGMAGDVAKMYRQIGLHEEDRDFHRLIWREDPNQPLEIFRMTRVTYGITSSSYHAIRALQSAADYAELPTTESALRRDFYVDDFLGGALDVDTAHRLKEDLTKSLSKVCMPIRKWSSNSAELLARIPEEDRETATVEVAKEEQGVKTLGIAWNTQRDKFVFTVPAALKAHSVFLNLNPKITRRGLLSATATIYDPLGWLAPLVIRMKILFQNSWDDAAGWDDVLSADKIYGFRKWIEDLLRLEFLELPRKILDISHPVDSVLELVLFCDASEQAMAACVYVVTRPKNYGDFTTSRLLAAKTKLAPRKTQTVPRLELGAMLLGARLVRAIQQSMEPLPFRIAKISAHTHSTVALAWVHSEPARWGVFVGNRVREIQELIPPGQWSHVTTDQNPADLATRDNVTSLEGLDFWWSGPRSLLTMAWAAQSENQPDPTTLETPDVLAEVRKRKVVVGTTIIHDEKKIGVLPIETISDFGRLLRIAQTVLRVFKKKDEIDFTDSVKHRALTQLVKQDQEYHYGELFEILRGEKQLPSNHGLRKLNPILHEDGTIRVGGRLTHSALPEQTVRPSLRCDYMAFGRGTDLCL